MDDYTDPALYVVGLPRLRALLEPVIVRYVMHLCTLHYTTVRASANWYSD